LDGCDTTSIRVLVCNYPTTQRTWVKPLMIYFHITMAYARFWRQVSCALLQLLPPPGVFLPDMVTTHHQLLFGSRGPNKRLLIRIDREPFGKFPVCFLSRNYRLSACGVCPLFPFCPFETLFSFVSILVSIAALCTSANA
jgi:hypothetical protein